MLLGHFSPKEQRGRQARDVLQRCCSLLRLLKMKLCLVIESSRFQKTSEATHNSYQSFRVSALECCLQCRKYIDSFLRECVMVLLMRLHVVDKVVNQPLILLSSCLK